MGQAGESEATHHACAPLSHTLIHTHPSLPSIPMLGRQGPVCPWTLVLLPFVARVAEALGMQQLSDHLAAGLHRASKVDLHLLDVHQHLGVHAAQAPHTPLHLRQIASGEAAAQLQAARRGQRGGG